MKRLFLLMLCLLLTVGSDVTVSADETTGVQEPSTSAQASSDPSTGLSASALDQDGDGIPDYMDTLVDLDGDGIHDISPTYQKPGESKLNAKSNEVSIWSVLLIAFVVIGIAGILFSHFKKPENQPEE